jgi:hypothetical protein
MDRQIGKNSDVSLGMNPKERKTGLRGFEIFDSKR